MIPEEARPPGPLVYSFPCECRFPYVTLTAQSTVPSAKFDPSQFNKAPKCDGAPDGVYMRSGTSYYACVNGKNVSNKDPGEIPAHLIRAYDVSRAQFEVKAKEHQAEALRHRSMTLREIHLERMSAKALAGQR